MRLLPGVTVEERQQFTVTPRIPGDGAVALGTATRGRVGEWYRATDISELNNEFGLDIIDSSTQKRTLKNGYDLRAARDYLGSGGNDKFVDFFRVPNNGFEYNCVFAYNATTGRMFDTDSNGKPINNSSQLIPIVDNVDRSVTEAFGSSLSGIKAGFDIVFVELSPGSGLKIEVETVSENAFWLRNYGDSNASVEQAILSRDFSSLNSAEYININVTANGQTEAYLVNADEIADISTVSDLVRVYVRDASNPNFKNIIGSSVIHSQNGSFSISANGTRTNGVFQNYATVAYTDPTDSTDTRPKVGIITSVLPIDESTEVTSIGSSGLQFVYDNVAIPANINLTANEYFTDIMFKPNIVDSVDTGEVIAIGMGESLLTNVFDGSNKLPFPTTSSTISAAMPIVPKDFANEDGLDNQWSPLYIAGRMSGSTLSFNFYTPISSTDKTEVDPTNEYDLILQVVPGNNDEPELQMVGGFFVWRIDENQVGGWTDPMIPYAFTVGNDADVTTQSLAILEPLDDNKIANLVNPLAYEYSQDENKITRIINNAFTDLQNYWEYRLLLCPSHDLSIQKLYSANLANRPAGIDMLMVTHFGGVGNVVSPDGSAKSSEMIQNANLLRQSLGGTMPSYVTATERWFPETYQGKRIWVPSMIGKTVTKGGIFATKNYAAAAFGVGRSFVWPNTPKPNYSPTENQMREFYTYGINPIKLIGSDNILWGQTTMVLEDVPTRSENVRDILLTLERVIYFYCFSIIGNYRNSDKTRGMAQRDITNYLNTLVQQDWIQPGFSVSTTKTGVIDFRVSIQDLIPIGVVERISVVVNVTNEQISVFDLVA